MQEESTRRIYDAHSGFYDLFFGKLVRRRVSDAIGRMNIKPGETVLDIGVGTGVSLPFYPQHAKVVGIDLSGGMLRQARRKVEPGQDITLMQADALKLPFADNAFDHVFISHVISVVSDPVAVIREMQRVTKPGARVVMLNHFQSSNKMVAKLEKMVSPICTKLGWRSDLNLHDLMQHTGIEIDYRYKLTTPDIWETVVFTNKK